MGMKVKNEPANQFERENIILRDKLRQAERRLSEVQLELDLVSVQFQLLKNRELHRIWGNV